MTHTNDWAPPPAILQLGPSDIHLWRLPLDLREEGLRQFRRYLCDDEFRRADRYKIPSATRRFVAARGWLRLILGRYLETAPSSLRFEYGEHGKPRLGRDGGGTPPCFNLSHAHELMLLAISWSFELGVDIEWAGRGLKADGIARRFFMESEWRDIESHAAEFRDRRFLEYWTCKEAILKGRGLGIIEGLDDVQIQLGTGPEARVVSRSESPGEARWRLFKLPDPAPDYLASLAINGVPDHIARFSAPTI